MKVNNKDSAKFLFEVREKLIPLRTMEVGFVATIGTALLTLVLWLIKNYVDEDGKLDFKWYYFRKNFAALVKIIEFFFNLNSSLNTADQDGV